MTVHVEMINTGELLESASGITQTVHYLVTGLSGDEYTRWRDALKQSRIPRKGAAHRGIPGIVVTERRVLPVTDSPSKAVVVVKFSRPVAGEGGDIDRSKPYGPTTWSGRTATGSETTARDWAGNLMRLDYVGRPTFVTLANAYGYYRSTDFVRDLAVSKAERDVGLLDVTASRWERDNPERQAAGFFGLLNATPWRSFPAFTVLTTGFDFQPDAAGGYTVRRVFSYSPAGWDHQDTITIDGRTPDDVRPGNGEGRWRIYTPFDFSRFGL